MKRLTQLINPTRRRWFKDPDSGELVYHIADQSGEWYPMDRVEEAPE